MEKRFTLLRFRFSDAEECEIKSYFDILGKKRTRKSFSVSPTTSEEKNDGRLFEFNLLEQSNGYSG